MQQIEPVPIRPQRADIRRELPACREQRRAIGGAQGGGAEDDHRLLGVLQLLGKARTHQKRLQRRAAIAQMLHRIGEIRRRPDRANHNPARQLTLADPGIEHRRLAARIGADQEDRIRLFDPGDRAVEAVKIAARGVDRGAILAAIEIL